MSVADWLVGFAMAVDEVGGAEQEQDQNDDKDGRQHVASLWARLG